MPNDTYWPDIDFLHNRRVREFGSSRTGLVVITIGVILVLALASLFHLMQVTQAATVRHNIQELEAEKRRLYQMRGELQFQIAQETELTRIRERARELGFVPADEAQVEYLSYDATQIRQEPAETVAMTQEEHAAPIGRESEINDRPQPTGGWWKRFVEQIARWTVGDREVLAAE